MENKKPFYDQIEAYLAGQLPPDEQEAMEKALRADPALAREVELRRLEFEVSESLIAENIRQHIRRLRAEPPPENRHGNKNRFLFWLIAAVLLITAIGIYRWQLAPEPLPGPGPTPTLPDRSTDTTPAAPQAVNPPANDNKPAPSPGGKQNPYLALAAELYQNPDFESLRGATSGPADPVAAALDAWQKEDYAAVVTALQTVAASDPKYWRAMTLTAHAQYKLEQYGTAARTFTTIADGKIQPWAEEADGYLLLAMLADGKGGTTDFRNKLKKVLDDPGHPWFEPARTIQSRLAQGTLSD